MIFDFLKKNKKSEGSARMGSRSYVDSKSLVVPKAVKTTIPLDELHRMTANTLRVLAENDKDQEAVDAAHSPEIPEREKLYRQYLLKTQCCSAFQISLNDAAIEEWDALASPEALEGIQTLMSLRDSGEAEWDESRQALIVPDAVIAGIEPRLWPLMGLPPLGGESIAVDSEGTPYSDDFSINVAFISDKRRLIRPTRIGLQITYGGRPPHLLPPEVFIVAETIEAYKNALSDPNVDRNFAWAEAMSVLSMSRAVEKAVAGISRAKLLTAVRVTAEVDDHGKLRPVILRPKGISGQSDDFLPLLLKGEKKDFSHFLDSGLPINGHVPLGGGTYLFMPPDTQHVVEAIRDINHASPDERMRFLENPRQAIMKALAKAGVKDDSLDDLVNFTFVETPEFISDRVKALGPWQRQTLSFMQPIKTDWYADGADRAGLVLHGQFFCLTQAELEKLISDLHEASVKGDALVKVKDTMIPVESINAASLLECCRKVFPQTTDKDGKPDEPYRDNKGEEDKVESNAEERVQFGPDIKRNLEALEYQAELVNRTPWQHPLSTLSSGLSLLPHQEEALSWLKDLWNRGIPGALLADDMGLGKTIECLAFAAWLAEGMKAADSALPTLIIAPAGLLENWLTEGRKWLGEAYGRGLDLSAASVRRMMKQSLTERTEQLEGCTWAVTTYESVRNQQEFFFQQNWGLIVLDEAQRIKNPTALLTECIKGLKSEFLLAMTGTPVENTFMDLWSILDATVPGVMGSAKTFSNRFCRGDDVASAETAGRELNALLLGQKSTEIAGGPSGTDLSSDAASPEDAKGIQLMLRRLKTDRLKDLKAKIEKLYRVPMPPEQAAAYQKVLNLRNSSLNGKASIPGLQLLHMLSAACLSPKKIGAAGSARASIGGASKKGLASENSTFVLTDEDIANSARFTALFKILDEVKAKNEKAVVFVLHVALQRALARKIQQHYKLEKEPGIINGMMLAAARQRVVREFQRPEKAGQFDVVILTSRAAGTGLTLTAANHVVHLERWWNPAVEDQCSDRCWRIGQTKDVVVHIPIAAFPGDGLETFDEKLQMFLTTKRARSQSVLMPSNDNAFAGELMTAVFGDEAPHGTASANTPFGTKSGGDAAQDQLVEDVPF